MTRIKERVEDLICRMTLEEKIGQMYQMDAGTYNQSLNSNLEVDSPVTGPEQGEVNQENLYNLGSILNSNSAEMTYKIQKKHMQNSRLAIPLMFMFDIIHGFRTIFPIPLGLACSWDTKLVKKTAQVAAREGSASGINVTFAPMADHVRDPRWGRVMESPGEDSYLNSKITAAYVKGFQQNNLEADDSLAACVKHFAAYGAAEAGRDYNTVDMSEMTLRNFYLPGYKGGIEAGAAMVMSSFNIFDGVPASASQFLFRQILRKEWEFEGVVISDWASVTEIAKHGAAKDSAEAAKRAVEAGIDIEMASTDYINNLKQLVEKRDIEENLIDESVRRILTLKFELGLFDDPFKYINNEGEKKYHLCSEHRDLSRKAAADSMVLLKNDEHMLPLSKNLKSIAIIGPFAESNEIIGFWSALGRNEEAVTLKQGLENKLDSEVEINTVKGCDWTSDDDSEIEAAIQAAKDSDVVILALGEHQEMSGEGGSRAYLDLPGIQQELAEEVMKLGKPTVLVLFNGRPLELKWYSDNIPAILEAWFPGTEGGNAVADVLFGDVNPSGKLTMSFPYTVGQIPVYYNAYSTGRPKGNEDNEDRFVSKYIDAPNAPLYPFGYGLSYTDFEYTNAIVTKDIIRPGEKVEVSVDIENIGDYSGQEIVQLYIRDLSGSIVRPVMELKDFKKISLEKGEEISISFVITEDMLKFYDKFNGFSAEPGEFKVFVGSSSKDVIDCGNITLID